MNRSTGSTDAASIVPADANGDRTHAADPRSPTSVFSPAAPHGAWPGGAIDAGLPMLSGVLLAVCFPPTEIAWAAWFALVPYAAAISRRRGTFELYLGAWVGGLVFHLIAGDWVRTSYGGTGMYGGHARWWFVMGVAHSVMWLAGFWLARKMAPRCGGRMVIALPVAWVAYEFMKRHAWTLIDETGYVWFQLGTTQADFLSLVQIADLAGVWGVTFVIAIVNAALFDAAAGLTANRRGATRQMWWSPLAVAGAVVSASLVYGAYRLAQPTPKAGPTVCLMPAGTIRAAANSPDNEVQLPALPRPADLLLWSETVVELDSEVGVADLTRLARSAKAMCVVGCIRQTRPGDAFQKFNSVAVVDGERGLLGYYDKTSLVPWTEFMPWTAPLLFPYGASELTRGSTYPSFSLKGRLKEHAWTFAATICYDTCFSAVHLRMLRAGNSRAAPDFFVVASRETPDLSITLQRHILAHARFRAVECRRALVRNVEYGYSGLIDSCGRLRYVDRALILRVPTVVGPIPIDERLSLYARLGDWLPMLSCAALVACLVAPSRPPSAPDLFNHAST